jgi:hypothetical protein
MKNSSFMSTYYPKVLEGEGNMKIEREMEVPSNISIGSSWPPFIPSLIYN